jgi:hypothetical protein
VTRPAVTRRAAVRGAALAIAAVLLAGCAGGADGTDGPAPVRTVAGPTTAPGSGVTCGPVLNPRIQSGGHLVGGNEPPVPYSSTPPSSGWHASGRVDTTVHDVELTDPQLVSVLEVGDVVVTYDREAVTDADVAVLTELAEGPLRERLAVTPYSPETDGPVMLVAWGHLRACDGVDPGLVEAFVRAYEGGVEGH